MWHVIHDRWHATCDKWHVTDDMWHMTCDTWHVTHRGWSTWSQNCRPLALTVWDLWNFEDWEEKDDPLNDWINELISNKGDCRNAPATLLSAEISYWCQWPFSRLGLFIGGCWFLYMTRNQHDVTNFIHDITSWIIPNLPTVWLIWFLGHHRNIEKKIEKTSIWDDNKMNMPKSINKNCQKWT